MRGPQFVKLAPVAAAFAQTGHAHVIVHTGQHYDARMSDVFFADLAIPAPDVHLGIGSGSHGVQTGGMLAALDPVLDELAPDWVLVYGDTNSTLAGRPRRGQAAPAGRAPRGGPALVQPADARGAQPRPHRPRRRPAARPDRECRSGTSAARASPRGPVLVGDVMTDVCLRVRDAVADDPLPADLPAARAGGAAGGFVLATVHRAENTDDPARLAAIVDALAGLEVPVALLAHPRLVARCEAHGIPLQRPALHPVPPLAYPDMVRAVLGSRGVVTDSGGLQKEAYLLGRAVHDAADRDGVDRDARRRLERPRRRPVPRQGAGHPPGADDPSWHAVR